MKVYCDTNVYIDVFQGRKDRFRDLAEFALIFFREVKNKKYKLVVSDWVMEEIEKVMTENKTMKEFLDSFEKEDILNIEKTKEDEEAAKKLSASNFPDALHVVLAKKADAVYLVTRNIQDFSEFRNIIEIVFPEQL